MKTSRVAVDASFLLKLFLPEDLSSRVEDHWRNWIESSIEVVAPTLIVFEASSVLRNKVFRRIVNEADASDMIDKMRHLELSLVYAGELMEMAWEIGKILKLPPSMIAIMLLSQRFLRPLSGQPMSDFINQPISIFLSSIGSNSKRVGQVL